jgi:hypothetical protein
MMTKTTIRSNAKRTQNLGLTVPVATRQARKIVDKVMPGVGATVESKSSFDLKTDTAIIITRITFPANIDQAARIALGVALRVQLSNHFADMREADSSFVITRKAK